MEQATDSAQKIKLPKKKKVAFVCSGGGSKAAAFHIGVALALREKGFQFIGGRETDEKKVLGPKDISVYVGSSAGSIVATLLAAGYSLENVFNAFLSKKPTDPVDCIPKVLSRLTYQQMFKLRPELAKEQMKNLRLIKDVVMDLKDGNFESLLLFRMLKINGFFSTAGIEQYFREQVLESTRFQDYIADLFIVATQLNDSKKVVFGKLSDISTDADSNCQYINSIGISDACAASSALPIIFAPYQIEMPDGQQVHFIDGEIRDTMSSHVAVDAGADLIFASYTHQPYHYTPGVGSLTELGLPAILIQSAYLLVEQKINHHIGYLRNSRRAIDAVSSYLKSEGVSKKIHDRACEILEKELKHRRDVDFVYIHPNPSDSKMFLREHFSLSPAKMAEVVKSGFRAATEELRKYEFT